MQIVHIMNIHSSRYVLVYMKCACDMHRNNSVYMKYTSVCMQMMSLASVRMQMMSLASVHMQMMSLASVHMQMISHANDVIGRHATANDFTGQQAHSNDVIGVCEFFDSMQRYFIVASKYNF